jgi:hypothetical protein
MKRKLTFKNAENTSEAPARPKVDRSAILRAMPKDMLVELLQERLDSTPITFDTESPGCLSLMSAQMSDKERLAALLRRDVGFFDIVPDKPVEDSTAKKDEYWNYIHDLQIKAIELDDARDRQAKAINRETNQLPSQDYSDYLIVMRLERKEALSFIDWSRLSTADPNYSEALWSLSSKAQVDRAKELRGQYQTYAERVPDGDPIRSFEGWLETFHLWPADVYEDMPF